MKETTSQPESAGKIMRRIRTENNLTQKDVAAILNIQPSRYSNYENGYSNPPKEIIELFNRCFDLGSGSVHVPENIRKISERHRANEREFTILNHELRDTRKMLSEIQNKRDRRRMILEFVEMIEEFQERIQEASENG